MHIGAEHERAQNHRWAEKKDGELSYLDSLGTANSSGVLATSIESCNIFQQFQQVSILHSTYTCTNKPYPKIIGMVTTVLLRHRK